MGNIGSHEDITSGRSEQQADSSIVHDSVLCRVTGGWSKDRNKNIAGEGRCLPGSRGSHLKISAVAMVAPFGQRVGE